MGDAEEHRLIEEEYKIWRKHTPLLYDLVVNNSLEWPSLTVQWLPDRRVLPGGKLVEQRLILGTHTAEGESNHLMIAKVHLPLPASEMPSTKYDQDKSDCGNFGGAAGKVEIVQQILHEGEVNRARYMPQNPTIIATKTPTSNVLIFDYSKHGSRPSADGSCSPEITLTGHEREGYGLSWNTEKEGRLISGSDDQLVCMWDIDAANKSQDPVQTFRGHRDVVEEVCWQPGSSDVLASVGDDGRLIYWDARQASPVHSIVAADSEVNSVSFNPFVPNLLAIAASNKTITLFDARKPDVRLHTLEGHSSEAVQVSWSPHNESVLASSGIDRRILVWDLSRVGCEQTAEDASDGPPELLFIHGGHTSKVSDFAWNPNEPWMLASTAEDNILQVWQMADNIYTEEEDVPDQPAGDLE